MSNKQKHLEFIQTIITRMGNNLFILKGWAVTLIVALFTFIAKDGNGIYILFSYFVLIIFWILDGYFLSRERCFRKLYNHVRIKKEKDIDFSMNYKKFEKGKNTWFRSIFSKTLTIFYGTLLVVISIVVFFLNSKEISIRIKLNQNKIYNEQNLRQNKHFFIEEVDYGKKSFF